MFIKGWWYESMTSLEPLILHGRSVSTYHHTVSLCFPSSISQQLKGRWSGTKGAEEKVIISLDHLLVVGTIPARGGTQRTDGGDAAA